MAATTKSGIGGADAAREQVTVPHDPYSDGAAMRKEMPLR
jgi:hypothetical protein